MSPPAKDMTGLVFHRLTVVGRLGTSGREPLWDVLCECGTRSATTSSRLRGGITKSCGCLKRETAGASKVTHGATRGGATKEYATWARIITRCTNPNIRNWNRYGGRGISVCERWRSSFEAFLADMGPSPSRRHSIDRYPNNDGNYEPGNCRWATAEQQARNTSAARILVIDGRALSVVEWAESEGCTVSPSAIYSRLSKDWPPRAAVFAPLSEVAPSAKLTAVAAMKIRERALAGERGKDLAAEFGISPMAVSDIKRGVTWRREA